MPPGGAFDFPKRGHGLGDAKLHQVLRECSCGDLRAMPQAVLGIRSSGFLLSFRYTERDYCLGLKLVRQQPILAVIAHIYTQSRNSGKVDV